MLDHQIEQEYDHLRSMEAERRKLDRDFNLNAAKNTESGEVLIPGLLKNNNNTTLNSKAEDLALSILEITQSDLNEILTGKDQTGMDKMEKQRIKTLEIEAELIRRGVDNDLKWQEKFVHECRRKKSENLHDFSQSLCKNLCDKVEELIELC